jgi:sugar phosphate permease
MTETDSRDLSAARSSRLVSGAPVFYGWIIMLAGSFGLIMTSPGQTYSVSIFIESFIADLGVSRSVVSTLYTAGTLLGSLAQPIFGRQIDRRGSRYMVVVIAGIFGLACIYMGFVSSAIMLGLGFTAIRMFGQGGLGLVCTNVMNQWWVRRRGTVLGISGVLLSMFGLGGFPNLINWLIGQFGWRVTYVVLGISLLLIMTPLGWLLFRNKPEAYGLQPDGGHPVGALDEPRSRLAEQNWLPSEAVRTSAYWILAAGLAAISMLATGLFFHMVSIFDDNGLSAAVAASVYVPIALTTAIANLGSGLLVNRVPLRVLLAVALFLQALSLWMAQFLRGAELALLYGLILGATMGLTRTVSSTAWAAYFGRRHLGSISGLSSTILVAGSALGPLPLGIARDVLGSYNQALAVLAVLPLLLAILAFFARRPSKRVAPPS